MFTLGKQIPSSKNPDSQFIAPYKKLLGTADSFKIYLVVLLEGIFIIGSFSYLGAYIDKTYHFNYLSIGFIMTAFGITAVIGGRLGGKMAAKLGRKKVLLLGLTLAMLADAIFTTAGNIIGLFILGVALLGLGFMLAHSTLLTMATEFATKARGAAMSLVAFCFMGGGGIGTAFGGKIINSVGFESFFLYYGVSLLVLILLAGVLLKSEKQKELTEGSTVSK